MPLPSSSRRRRRCAAQVGRHENNRSDSLGTTKAPKTGTHLMGRYLIHLMRCGSFVNALFHSSMEEQRSTWLDAPYIARQHLARRRRARSTS